MAKKKSAEKKKKAEKIRVVVNGLGRVGRVFLRVAWDNPYFEIVGANSRSPIDTYAHLIKYDSAYGTWEKEVGKRRNNLVIDGKSIPYIQTKDEKYPWKKLKVDVVVEASGRAKTKDKAKIHLEAGAKYVLVTAPMNDPDETFVYGVNHQKFNPKEQKIISAASCTTVCSTLIVKVLEENFGFKQGYINTIHGVTNDQKILDSSHKDLRRARSAMGSIIPTTTGVSNAIVKIYPNLKGKISAMALRVPVINPSIVVMTAELKKKTNAQAVNRAFERASKGKLQNHLGVSKLPLVSKDFLGNPNGSIIDMLSTDVVDGKLLNLYAWYDNEWGYVKQTVYLLEHMAKEIMKQK